MNGTERTALNCDCLLSQGPQGPQGEQGSQGPQGVPGESGPKGDTGNDGKSAYQQAVEGGYTGSEEEFKEELARLPYQAQEAVSAHNLSPESHADIRQALETLQFVTWVDVLPETGESKYIYAVPREETDTEGKQIAALYLWDGSAWRGAGAFSLNIDPDTLATKTELAGYLPKTGGDIIGSLSIARAKGVIETLMPEAGSGSGYTRLRIYSYDGNWVGYLLHNKVGDAAIVLVEDGNLNIDVANNKEARIGGKRILTIIDKGIANGIASLDASGKVPQEQLPNISAATSVVGLGQIAEASFEVNKNYAASVSGSASITLPTPTDTTIANKITVNLTVLSAANINWGVNANAALAQFEPGKYQIRLLWNNNSSAWSAEVLKETRADSGVSDLHDIKMAELYSSISALQNELQILKGQSMKRLDYTNAVEFYLKEEDQTSYTVPANGYIFGYGFQTYKTGNNSYTGNILINGINVGIYFRRYTLSNDQVDTSIPLSMPLPVSAGDVITITGNREAFQEPYLFVPEKED